MYQEQMQELGYSSEEIQAANQDLHSKNKLSDDIWETINPSNLSEITQLNFRVIDNPRLELLAKQFIRSRADVEADGTLFLKNSKSFIDSFLWLKKALDKTNNSKSKIVSLPLSELLNLFLHTMSSNRIGKSSEDIIAFNTLEHRYNFIRILTGFYLSGSLYDGPNELPSFNVVLDYIKPAVEKQGDYVEWLQGGTFGDIPLPILSVYLSEAMDIFASEKTKWVQALTQFVKEYGDELPKTYMGKVKKAADRKWEPYSKRPKYIESLLNILMKTFKVNEPSSIPAFPFENAEEYSHHNQLIYASALIIFFALTGARISEIVSITKDDLIKDNANKIYKFRSEIKKTDNAIKTVRYVAGLAYEAYELLQSCSLDNDMQNIFYQRRRWTMDDVVPHGSYQTISIRIKDFATHVTDKYGEEFAWSPTAHQFRHSFAHFALRRFDGNIRESIRRHFRHHAGSFMTNHYLQGKLYEGVDAKRNDSELLDSLLKSGQPTVKDYFKEIIERAANGEHFFGHIGRWINSHVSNIDIADPASIESMIDEFEGEIHPHEYGYCMVLKSTKMQAQCYDKETGMAVTDEAKWSLCGGCVNRMSMESQLDDIMRIGQKSQQHIEDFTKLGLIKLVQQEEENVKTAMAAVKEITEGRNNV